MNEKAIRERLAFLSTIEKHVMEMKQRAQHKLAEAENENMLAISLFSFVETYREHLREQLATFAKDAMK